MNGNYIKIDRKMLSWEWYQDINTKVVFLHCLLKANRKDGRFEGKEVKRGSFVTSLSKLAAECNLSVMQVRTALEHLKLTNEITIEATSKFRIITVNNYDLYQTDNSQPNKQVTSEQQTNNKQVTNEQQASNKQVTTIEERKKERINNNTFSNENVCNTDKSVLLTNNIINNTHNPLNNINNNMVNDNVIINNNTGNKNIKLCMDKWNELKGYGIKPISRLNSGTQRYTMLQARLNEYGIDDVLKAIDNIKSSEFLQGKTSSWVITFDWFVRPNNFIKVLDGNYDDTSRSKPKNKTAEMLDDFYDMTSRWAEKMEREEQLKNDS